MAVGEQFGAYRLRRKLARGGMADIFLATKRVAHEEQLCVLKMMLPGSLRKASALKLFLGEARLAALLHHSNIVEIAELDRVDDYYFIAMEYVPGETLYHLIQQSTKTGQEIKPAHAAQIIEQVCRGLAYAHSMVGPKGQALNLVHRDISPSNLILSYDGQVKILDFGIAAADTRKANFAEGRAVGKYAYMSPEQCRGRAVDNRSDIFSLGVVFWELLTGSSLFSGPDPRQVMATICSGEVPRPSSVVPGIPEALEDVVMRALAHEPNDRPSDARAMGQAIEEACLSTAMPSPEDLAQLMVAQFGKRAARLSRLGDVGQALELETLLFDDIDSLGTAETSAADTEGLRSREFDALPARSRTPLWIALAIIGLLALGSLLFLKLSP